MKRIFPVLLCVLSVLTFSGSLVGAEGEGRYALFQGKYSRYDGTQGIYVETQDVFMLDTVTGEVSVLMSSVDEKGRRVRYWEPVSLDETKDPHGF